MEKFSGFFSKIIKFEHLPIILLVVICLVIGSLTFKDYGLSWDEPLFYAYADAIGYAYSIPERLGDDFDLERAYGPSATDHKIYGPAYLIIARGPVYLLNALSGIGKPELWHLVNFIVFQIGAVLFYLLCKRWMNSWAAFAASLLLVTQPLLWGHAFINPKDPPFLVFFTAGIYFGFKMVDKQLIPSTQITQEVSLDVTDEQKINIELSINRFNKARRIIQIICLLIVIVALGVLIFSNAIQDSISDLIQTAYQASPENLVGKLFSTIASRASAVPVDAYINKALVWFSRIRLGLLILFIPALLLGSVITIWPDRFRRFFQTLANTLAPLPTRPSIWGRDLRIHKIIWITIFAGILLGINTNIRVLGPLVGILVLIYFFLRYEHRYITGIVIYLLFAVLVTYVSWPYLWDNPIANFLAVFNRSSDNPLILGTLFNGQGTPSNELPFTYLPTLMGITLTEPVWILFIIGVIFTIIRFWQRKIEWRSMLVILAWFIIPFLYVLVFRPAMYDGYRHFLFILPPVFIVIGMAFQAGYELIKQKWLQVLLTCLLVIPGIYGMISIHPYQYTYYNAIVGGVSGANRIYETDYWLTCYKETFEAMKQDPPNRPVFVSQETRVAEYYAGDEIQIEPFVEENDLTEPGDILLLTTRRNLDQKVHPNDPILFSIGIDGAVFCVVKQVQ
jgi:hypothetical protein